MHCFLLRACQLTISIGLPQQGHVSCPKKVGPMENHVVWWGFWIFSMRELSYIQCAFIFFYIWCICNFTDLYPRSLFILCIKKILTTTFWILCFHFLDGGRRDKRKCEHFYFVVGLSIQYRFFMKPFFLTLLFSLVSQKKHKPLSTPSSNQKKKKNEHKKIVFNKKRHKYRLSSRWQFC